LDSHSSLSEAQRELAVASFEQGLGYWSVATLMGVSRWPVKRLHQRWQMRGRGALVEQRVKPSYSFEFKLALVERFLAGEPAGALAVEGGLSSPQLLKTWARTYRREGADGLRPKPRGRPATERVAAGEMTEVERLRRENERLRAEVAYLGKLQALRAQERQ